jgi:opacity protein-like surface antigen
MKINKILGFAIILISIFAANQAHAKRQKTEGFIFGIEGLYSSATHQYITDQKVKTTKFKESDFGYGVNIKYAYNIDDLMPMEPLIPFFVFIEAFWQDIGTSARDRSGDLVNLNSRYGGKLGMGLDFADDFLLYGSFGAASIDYEIDWSALNINLADNLKKKSGSKVGLVYGAGIGYYLTENFIISLELNIQRLELDSIVFPSVNAANGESIGNTDKVRTNLLVTQLGLSFKF